MNYKEKAQDIYNLMGQGKLLDAFDKYYGDNVVMTEPRGTREGKTTCRNYEEQFLGMVKEFHGLEVTSIASDEENGVTFIESTMDITFQDGNRVKMEQISRQQWEGDHITHERFYYNNG
ncbi:MAG: nuclear transport factor 2 family protein [Bacteroidota bacterium]